MPQTNTVCGMLVFATVAMAKEPTPRENKDEHRDCTGVSATLGSFIRAQREMADLSLRQLSAMAEISNAYLSQIERDLHEPSIRVLNNVGKALGISPEMLMTKAGLISQDDASGDGAASAMSTEDAIAADPYLTDGEKQSLLTVYRSYRSAKN